VRFGTSNMHLAQDRGHWWVCEHGNGSLGPIKGREFLGQLSDY
jgi:hypothetical protein